MENHWRYIHDYIHEKRASHAYMNQMPGPRVKAPENVPRGRPCGLKVYPRSFVYLSDPHGQSAITAARPRQDVLVSTVRTV